MIDAIKNVASLSMTRGLGSISSTDSTQSSGLTSGIVATPGATTGTANNQSFASVMSDMATGAVDNLKKAENASFEGIKGTMNTREVVDAVMQADQSLQTVMAVRDKVVSAFLDITKMQI